MPLIPIFKGYLLGKWTTMKPTRKDIVELRFTLDARWKKWT
jgi:hypothetical protein